MGDVTASSMLSLERDYLAETLDISSMRMGQVVAWPDAIAQAQALFDGGVRRVELARVVDLTATESGWDAVAALVLIRELTAYGLVVSWQLRLPEDMHLPLLLGHLHPPDRITGVAYGDVISEGWRRKFYIGKCFWRKGPGFIEVRD